MDLEQVILIYFKRRNALLIFIMNFGRRTIWVTLSTKKIYSSNSRDVLLKENIVTLSFIIGHNVTLSCKPDEVIEYTNHSILWESTTINSQYQQNNKYTSHTWILTWNIILSKKPNIYLGKLFVGYILMYYFTWTHPMRPKLLSACLVAYGGFSEITVTHHDTKHALSQLRWLTFSYLQKQFTLLFLHRYYCI